MRWPNVSRSSAYRHQRRTPPARCRPPAPQSRCGRHNVAIAIRKPRFSSPIQWDDRIDCDVVRHQQVQTELLLGPREVLDLRAVENERRHAARRARPPDRCAQKENQRAAAAFVIHCFSTAHVPAVAGLDSESEPASDPAPGSVSAKHPICEPCARRHEGLRGDLRVGAEREDRQRARARVHREREQRRRRRARAPRARDIRRPRRRARRTGSFPELGEQLDRGLHAIPIRRRTGSISAAASSRATAWISRCSGVSSKSTRGRLPR